MQAFEENYRQHQYHAKTGLYFWSDDLAIGVDNDPATFFRPAESSGSIFLNCLMYKELQAMAYLARQLGLDKSVGDGYDATGGGGERGDSEKIAGMSGMGISIRWI